MSFTSEQVCSSSAMKIYDLLTYQGFPADFVTVSHTRVFVRSCDVNPADLEGPAHLTFSEPGLFVHEQVQASTLCQIRKSRAVTRGMRSFPLLLSAALRQVCLYVCVSEKDGIREMDVNVRRRRVRAQTKGQKSLHEHLCGPSLCVLPGRTQGAVYYHPTRGSHDSNKRRYSCQLRSMTMTHAELWHPFTPVESSQLCPLN